MGVDSWYFSGPVILKLAHGNTMNLAVDVGKGRGFHDGLGVRQEHDPRIRRRCESFSRRKKSGRKEELLAGVGDGWSGSQIMTLD